MSNDKLTLISIAGTVVYTVFSGIIGAKKLTNLVSEKVVEHLAEKK